MSPPKYLDTCPELRANKPVDHPHLLHCSDAKGLLKCTFTFADALATVLYNWKPEALSAFLDRHNDKFIFKSERAPGSAYFDWVIARTGNTVVCGGYQNLDEFDGKELYDWHFHVRYGIAKSGKWLSRYAIGYGFSEGLFDVPEK